MRNIVWVSIIAAVLSITSVVAALIYSVVLRDLRSEVPITIGLAALTFAVLATRE